MAKPEPIPHPDPPGHAVSPLGEGAVRFVFSGSIRRALIVLVLASVLPALGIILYTGLEARRHALRDSEASALLLARSVGEVQGRTTQGIRQLLLVLSKSPCLRDAPGGSASHFLESIVEATPILSNINVTNLVGDILASSSRVEKITLADRSYFQAALRTNSFAAGEYQIGKVSGIPTFAFGAPMSGEDGRPTGVVVVGVRLGESYEKIFQEAHLPKDSVLGITDRNGIRICRYPKDDSITLGEPLPQSVWDVVSGGGDQGTFIREGVDGVRRVYAFIRLRLEPENQPYLYIFVGIPEEHGLEGANALLRRNLLLMALATALALATSWYLGKLTLGSRIDRLVAVTGRLGTGDLAARVENAGPGGELGRLEMSVNTMAQALAEAAQNHTLYEHALKKAHEELEQRVDARTRELREANERLRLEIRARARIQKDLRRSEETHRALYEQAPVGILVMDAAGLVLDANPAALSLLGYSLEGIKGTPYANLIHPDSLAARPVDYEALFKGRMISTERVFLARDGSSLPVDLSGRLVDDRTFQVIFQDATERKKLEQLREDVERITRHDLKTPLMGMVQMSELLLRGDNLTPKQHSFLEMLREAGYRMLHTINMSLALYKMEAHSYDCDRTEFDMLGVVQQVAGETSHLGSAKDVGVTVLLDQNPPGQEGRFLLYGEEQLCLTMLENLIKNAIEASPEGGNVRLALSSTERTLTIRNAGEVPHGIRERFFEKYATEGKKWGTGLGTYSARLIATTHDWDIRLDCSVAGETSIIIHFPPETA